MNIVIATATDAGRWDAFLNTQPYTPFLQSWTMGEVYAELHQLPVRLEILDDEKLIGICFAHIVPARRGRHLSIPYGPIITPDAKIRVASILPMLFTELKRIAIEHSAAFIRLSPFTPDTPDNPVSSAYRTWLSQRKIVDGLRLVQSPLHLLGEYLWLLDLQNKTEEEILMSMRKTTRNLIRRAQKEGVEIIRSQNPVQDVGHFIRLHDETRLRHGFTPYTNRFFREQVKHFAPRNECSVYLATYQNEIIAASIHMHCGGETSYHHGASTHRFPKIPASYVLQWTAITDAMKRGDRVYNFWGIAPLEEKIQETRSQEPNNSQETRNQKPETNHPFAGVTLFKTGFGGYLLPLVHCMDIPVKPWYAVTRAIELFRKWRRGF